MITAIQWQLKATDGINGLTDYKPISLTVSVNLFASHNLCYCEFLMIDWIIFGDNNFALQTNIIVLLFLLV